ncbi:MULTISPECIES: helix-turn-helix domain-containing protein [Pectobacterium]|uniref:helix-turn-helix domain-containing protein n=1 Tax=Pectobacterium TaxID=122277 RepID=UPI0011988312|nr:MULTISPECIES: helix-turn-helix transcriptional regulator [Pectobacterium]MDY4388705.1 helix-turn-helix transcriptional regulator [Pectobacterium aroidearum]QDX97078.1 XRE family transcriptional regulator [Pectobacterium carotovorum subsp. carotovorum]
MLLSTVDNTVIGKRLRLARVNAGLKQAELGCLAGLDEETSSSRVSQYEREVSSPDFGLVCRFAAVLDVPEAYFYAVDEDLATLILQYHRYKKSNPNTTLFIMPQ